MNLLNVATAHRVHEESPDFQPEFATVGKLQKLASDTITLRNKNLDLDDHSVVIMLTLLVLVREIATGVGVGPAGKEIFPELDRSISNLIDYCRAETQDWSAVQTKCAANIGISPVTTGVGLAPQRLTLRTIGEKLCDIAGSIQGDSADPMRCDEIADQRFNDCPTMPSRSPLTGVMSYSSSLNECWFW